TEILRELGFEVIRFTNDEVLTNIDGVKSKIIEILNSRPDFSSEATPSPWEKGPGDEGHSTPLLGRGAGGEGLPVGNDGLGLMLLGITGDQILPPDVYARIKA